MFQARLALIFMALAFLSIRVPAQSPQPSESMTSAENTQQAFYAPINSTVVDSRATETASSSAERTHLTLSPKQQSRNFSPLRLRPFSRIAIGIKADTLGAGIELATPLSRGLNLRATVNAFNYTYPFTIDGINYDAGLNFKSGQMSVDWFPFHGEFHISPGLIYFKNGLAGKASVSAGLPFQLSGTSYINSVDDPVNGTVAVTYPRKIAPVLTFGFGNIIPRSGRHFSVPFELGAAYLGAAQMDIKLVGTACTAAGCFNAATDPGTQSSLAGEVHSLNDDLARFKVYPIVSLGLGYRF